MPCTRPLRISRRAGCLNFKQLFLPNPSEDMLAKAAARIADSDVLYQQATKGAPFVSFLSLFFLHISSSLSSSSPCTGAGFVLRWGACSFYRPEYQYFCI
jgi:hypothetical protein